ncbi:hypothetical protein ESOMN_v1c01030 [Williamsoniiplasma somnilux]|uniref:Uncharacterized protein n=1 Tax=Williamsoniiplasma somnilux TaxID=215578 RepID=A0A2K8NZ46_9MOLU|nr:hypothetical protein [Williamsoniiplasma somnilux]ATZ18488.1 hypothetical protein ESOMN_v1c01030 [Williamsoniiplasma somnilux]
MNKLKFNFNFKNNLNWKIKDANLEIQRKNWALYKVSFFSALIFLVVLSPFYVFIYITQNNINLDFYLQNINILSEHLNVPNNFQIIGLLWMSVGFIVLSLILILFLKPFVTMKNRTENMRLIYVMTLTGSFTLSLLLGALSQYNYSQFEEFFKYEALTTADTKVEWIKFISSYFTKNWNDKIDIYNWQSNTIVWWSMFMQLMVVFGITITVQNKIFSKKDNQGIERYITYTLRSKNISANKTLKSFLRIFRVSEKTMSGWLIIVAIFAILPQLIFTILLTVPTTNINSVLNWTYKINYLLQDYSTSPAINEAYNNLMNGTNNGSFFIVNSLPIIMTGVTISSTFFFVSALIRGNNSSDSIFAAQYFVLFLGLITLTSFSAYTKIEINKIAELWNSDNTASSWSNYLNVIQEGIKDDWKSIITLYPLNGIQGKFKLEWLSTNSTIAETIIELSFIIATFAIVGYESFKIKNNKLIN